MTDELRRLAEKATPGPWGPADSRDALNPENDPDKDGAVQRFLGWNVPPLEQSERGMFANGHDAAYIAAANPTVILALLDVVEAAREVAEGGWVVTDGETSDEWCFFCDKMTGHETWCSREVLRTALAALGEDVR